MSTLPLPALFVYSVNVSLVPVDYLVHHKINLVSSNCSEPVTILNLFQCVVSAETGREKEKKKRRHRILKHYGTQMQPQTRFRHFPIFL